MRQTHRLRTLWGLLLLAVLVVPANAQPTGMQRVTDPKGRFTISVPIGWEVMSINAAPLVGALVRDQAKDAFSMLMAMDRAKPESPTGLVIMGFALPQEITPQAFGTMMSRPLDPKALEHVTVVQEGNATIAGRPAFYRYMTMTKGGEDMYAVMVFFAVGRDGYLIVGVTRNAPETFRRDFAVISRILETFRPISKPGPSSVP